MPPSTNLKSFRPAKVKLDQASYDSETHMFTFKDEFGFDFKVRVRDLLNINPNDEWINNIPEYRVQFDFEPISVKPSDVSLKKEDIIEILKEKSMIPELLIYDTMTIGFVYSPDPTDPLNHTWMLEFWDADLNHTSVMHFLDVRVRNCNMNSRFWKKGGVYHGRFQLSHNEIKIIKEHEQNKVTIHGFGEPENAELNLSLLSKETEKLRFRYNIKTNYWYADQLDKKGETVSEPIKFRSFLGDNVSLDGNVIWAEKPKVMMYMHIRDISSIKLMTDTLLVKGR